jgi:hypothetical protein
MTYFFSPAVTDWQRQIVLGTILGGSSLVKPKRGRNCCLFMRSRNQLWLSYKAEELKELASQKPLSGDANTYRWHSNCFPVFNEFYELFYYRKKKTVPANVLDSLRDIGLAIWYGDSGKVVKKCAVMNTHRFGTKGTQTVARYFRSITYNCEVIKERGNLRVRLDEESTQRFFRLIGHRLPGFMWHKLETSGGPCR